jgi:hypothetical protein
LLFWWYVDTKKGVKCQKSMFLWFFCGLKESNRNGIKNYQSSAGQFSVLNFAFSDMKQPQRGQRDVFPKVFPKVK